MAISVFDLYTIGIGPSSSHTVGPMRAASMFLDELKRSPNCTEINRIIVELYGSLALTGKGHGSDMAILLGLCGERPETVDPDTVEERLARIRRDNSLVLYGKKEIAFDEKKDLLFHRGQVLPKHPNGMCFQAFDKNNRLHLKKIYYSIGGGFVRDSDDWENRPGLAVLPYNFENAAELVELCESNQLSISQLMFENEKVWWTEEEIRQGLLQIWQAMQNCVKRGLCQKGILPGGLKVKRRAPEVYQGLLERGEKALRDPLSILDWVNLYALAVNEENAAGGRVVTAPTNGAAGILPAVLHYFDRFCVEASQQKIIDFLLTAGAIAILYKKNASISGADVGCQGEVGVACSMAAGALTEVMGGNVRQVENAAEIAMEHNLGLTCDPIGGLVQIPCIERNAMAAVKAINAARMALRGDGEHFVSLDKVIKTMWQTGQDMQDSYKETSRGGLAVNIIEC